MVNSQACVRLLDVGCGSGISTLALRNQFSETKIVGVDLSACMLENAKKLLPEIEWIQRDCSESLEDLGQFDLVFSNAFFAMASRSGSVYQEYTRQHKRKWYISYADS